MNNFLWYLVCAISFYTFTAFMTVQAYLNGNVSGAIEHSQIGATFAVVSFALFSGYYLWHVLPELYTKYLDHSTI